MWGRLWHWLFEVPAGSRSFLDVFLWWEIRRIAFNMIVGCFGAICFMAFLFFILHTDELQPGEDAFEPLGLLAVPFLINCCYTFGWIIEGLLVVILPPRLREKVRLLGPRLFMLGMGCTLLVLTLPAVFWGIVYLRGLR